MSRNDRAGRSAWRVCAALWCAVTAPVAAFTLVTGALWLGVEGLLVLGVVGGVPATVYLCLRDESPGDPPSGFRAVHALAGAGAVIALVGTLGVLGGPGLLLGGLLAGTGLLLHRWRQHLARLVPPVPVQQPPLPADLVRPVPGAGRRGPHGHRHATSAGSPDVVRLCAVWRSSYTALQQCTDPARRAALVATREECLAGLEQSAPEAFDRWLATRPGAADDPTDFFTRHRSGQDDGVR